MKNLGYFKKEAKKYRKKGNNREIGKKKLAFFFVV